MTRIDQTQRTDIASASPGSNPFQGRSQFDLHDLYIKRGQMNQLYHSLAVQSDPVITERWKAAWADKTEVREFLNPAYSAAVTPYIGSAIEAVGKSEVILGVLGGGDGHFSRKMASQVNSWLDENASRPIRLKIVETDIDPIVSKIPGGLVGSITDLPKILLPKIVDIAVAESVFHVADSSGGRTALQGWMAAIKTILAPQGYCLHIQDFRPPLSTDPDWARATQQRERKARMALGDSYAMGKYVSEARHAELAMRIFDASRQSDFQFGLVKVEAEREVPSLRNRPGMIQKSAPEDDNVLEFKTGVFSSIRDASIGRGKQRLSYEGILTIQGASLTALNAVLARHALSAVNPVAPQPHEAYEEIAKRVLGDSL